MADYISLIERDPKVLLGKPVIKGTRISVEIILKKMSEGADLDDILEMYPSLAKEHVFAALAYSSALIANEEIRNVI